MTAPSPQVSRLGLGLALWALGMLGVIAMSVSVLPQLALDEAPLPRWVIVLASITQSGALLGLAVSAGVRLAPALGLRAPLVESLVAGGLSRETARRHILPGLISGVFAGTALSAIAVLAPDALQTASTQFSLALHVRVFYGGITEELLLRWGFMTVLLWIPWRFLQGRKGAPRTVYVWLAICLSALLFGAAHLPMAAAIVEHLSASIVAYVVGANAAFGVLFGYLFWRHGLEAAMVAHALAHVVSHVLLTL